MDGLVTQLFGWLLNQGNILSVGLLLALVWQQRSHQAQIEHERQQRDAERTERRAATDALVKGMMELVGDVQEALSKTATALEMLKERIQK